MLIVLLLESFLLFVALGKQSLSVGQCILELRDFDRSHISKHLLILNRNCITCMVQMNIDRVRQQCWVPSNRVDLFGGLLGLGLVLVDHGVVALLLKRDRAAMGASHMTVTEGWLTSGKHRRILVAGQGMMCRVHI